jgi:hypothetical protein
MLDVSILQQKLFLKNAIEFMSTKFYLSLYDCNTYNTNPYGTVCGHVVKYEVMEPKNTQILVELTTDLYVHYTFALIETSSNESYYDLSFLRFE